MHLIGVYLTGINLTGVHLTGMHLMSVSYRRDLTGVQLVGGFCGVRLYIPRQGRWTTVEDDGEDVEYLLKCDWELDCL